MTEPEPMAEKTPSRGRRGGGRRSKGASAKSSSSPPPEETPTPVSSAEKSSSAKPSGSKTGRGSSSRGGRGRRGGSRRTAAAPAETAEPGSEPAPIIPLHGEAGTLEMLLTRQQAALEEMTERQVNAIKGLQGTLSAIENRLVDVGQRIAERPRSGVFVDAPNIMYAAEREKTTIDFGKLLEFLSRDRELVRASAYAPISDDPSISLETQRFVQPFVGFGYRIVTKPLKRYGDGSIKANFDVELAMEALTMSDRLDILVLVSGDGDFRHLVELVASKGVRVHVAAFGNSTAAELRAVADEYTDIQDHLAEFRPG